jgi:hypothetical protein
MYDSLKDKQVDDDIQSLEESAVLDEKFIDQMRYELKANALKGNWQEWKPDYEHWSKELDHHIKKLKHAIKVRNFELVKEFSADTANLCEKAFTTFKNSK